MSTARLEKGTMSEKASQRAGLKHYEEFSGNILQVLETGKDIPGKGSDV